MSEAAHLRALGLEPGASKEEIRSAYRRIARDNHPDKSPGDEAAATRFRAAAEAYRALGSRASSSAATPPPEAPRSAGDVFDAVFNRQGASRGHDLRYTLTLSLAEVARGGERTIRVPGRATCRRCGGTGAELGSSPILCQTCKGSGSAAQRRGPFELKRDCPTCRGRGRLQSDPCGACRGSGDVEVEREIPFLLPPGVQSGTRLRVAGEGEPGRRGGEPGDLFVVIEVAPHPLFERDGNDLVVEVPISFAVAALGGHVRVPTLDGIVRARVPPGSASGRVLLVKRKGIDGGDIRITLRIEVPESLDDATRAALETYAALEKEHDQLPGARAYDALIQKLDQSY